MNSRIKLSIYYNITFLYPCAFLSHIPHHHNLQELVALTLLTFIILVSLALVTDCYVIIIVPSHPHPLTLSQCHLSIALTAPPFVAVQGHHRPGPMRWHRCCQHITVAGNCGALVCISERCISVGGIVNHDRSIDGGPPDNAELSNPFPSYHCILQQAHPPSADGRDDVARRDPPPERTSQINVCYPRATPLAIDGKGESQLAGGHDNHKWQQMRWWGCKALPLPRRKRSGRGDRGLPGPLLRRPVPALLLLPGATTYCGPPQRGVGPAKIATILHLHNSSSILGPGDSRKRGGHSSRQSQSAREGGNRRCKGGIPRI